MNLIKKAMSKSTRLMWGLFTGIGGLVAGFGLWGALNRVPELAVMAVIGGIVFLAGEYALMED